MHIFRSNAAYAPPGAGRALLPVRGEFLEGADVLGVYRNAAARNEVPDGAAHHLARTADARGKSV